MYNECLPIFYEKASILQRGSPMKMYSISSSLYGKVKLFQFILAFMKSVINLCFINDDYIVRSASNLLFHFLSTVSKQRFPTPLNYVYQCLDQPRSIRNLFFYIPKPCIYESNFYFCLPVFNYYHMCYKCHSVSEREL